MPKGLPGRWRRTLNSMRKVTGRLLSRRIRRRRLDLKPIIKIGHTRLPFFSRAKPDFQIGFGQFLRLNLRFSFTVVLLQLTRMLGFASAFTQTHKSYKSLFYPQSLYYYSIAEKNRIVAVFSILNFKF